MNLRRPWTWLILLGVVAASPVLAQDSRSVSGPLDVDDAVRIALERSPTYRQAQASLVSASGSHLSAAANLLPSLSGSANWSKSDRNSVNRVTEINGVMVPVFDLPSGTKSTSKGAGFSINQSLSLPLWFGLESAGASKTAARHGLDWAAQDLVFQVRQQFYLVLRAQDLLVVQEEDLRLARDEERRINSMFELGSVARVDVLKAKVRVADAEVALIQQRNQVAIENSNLAFLLGLAPDQDLEILGSLDDQVGAVDSVGAVNGAMDRLDVRQAREFLASASHTQKAASTSRLPGFFASFDWSKSDGDNESSFTDFNDVSGRFEVNNSLSDFESDGWSFSVGASLNLDAFLNSGDTKRAGGEKMRSEAQLEQTQLAALREVEEAILVYRASVAQISAAEDGVESAQEDLRLSTERYQQGLGTVLELLESQVNLTRARNQRVNALTGLKIAEAALERARGAPIPR